MGSCFRNRGETIGADYHQGKRDNRCKPRADTKRGFANRAVRDTVGGYCKYLIHLIEKAVRFIKKLAQRQEIHPGFHFLTGSYAAWNELRIALPSSTG